MAEADSSRTCPNCGNVYPASQPKCPRCGNHGDSFFFSFSWETVLSISVALLVVFFFVTGFFTRLYHQKLESLSTELYAEGEEHLKAGDATLALANFHDALVYTPDDFEIQFRLAEALEAAGRDTEANTYLLGLLTRSPSDADINLALARIAVAHGSEADAKRYYHGAIFGIWASNPLENRLNARLELCRFLIQQKDMASAQAELVALASEIPAKNASLHEQTAEMFDQAGDNKDALDEYRQALEEGPTLAEALRGAGLIEYELGDYREAERYLLRVHSKFKNDAEVSTALQISRLVLAADPNERGLSEEGRRNRVLADFQQAVGRLEGCAKSQGIDLFAKAPPESEFDKLYSQVKAMRLRLGKREVELHPGNLDDAMKLTYAIEEFAGKQNCGAPSPEDRALLKLNQSANGSGQ